MSDSSNANRNYKDSVFKDLFSDKTYLMKLYQELHPEDPHVSEADLEIITIQNVLVNAIYNDLCFRVKDRLIILVEHQSTVNENMPLRMLMYLAEEYKRYVIDKNIYKRKRIMLPIPEFYVVYTGEGKYPDTLRLSDSFDGSGTFGIELEVKIIKHSSGILGEYMYLVRLVELYKKRVSLGEAIELALNHCIQKGILAEYLGKKKREVFDLLEEEFSFERFEEAIREEGVEIGIQKGKEETLLLANKVIKLVRKGYDAEEIACTLNIPEETVRRIIE